MSLQGSDGHVVANIVFHNDSDRTLKTNVENVDIEDCYNVLKNVNAKTCIRNYIKDGKTFDLLHKIFKQVQRTAGQI